MFNLKLEPKVLLVLPTNDEIVVTTNRSSFSPAYGLNILATALRQEGLETIVLDEYIMRYSKSFCNLNSWIKAVELILCYYPSITCIGISILTNFRRTAIQLSRSIKNSNPNMLILWGGPHVTSLDKLLFNKFQGVFDIMVSGVTDFGIIGYIKDSILSSGNKKQSVILVGNPVNDIAKKIYPNYNQYLRSPGNNIAKIITRTSTGCQTPSCIFCGANFLEGHYCASEIKTVQNEVKRLITYNPKRIEFHDQDLCNNIERLKQIIQLNTISKIEEAYCHSNLHSLTKEHLDFFIKTGVKWEIFIGLESASAEIRQYIGKQMLYDNIEQYLIRLNNYVTGSNIRLGLFIMYGVPIEKPSHIKETKELLEKLPNIDICFSLMKVFPGTIIAKSLINKGLIDETTWLDEDGPPILTAVQGKQLSQTIEAWQDMLISFPTARVHNQIDRLLLNTGF